jgi:hypothetical protein
MFSHSYFILVYANIIKQIELLKGNIVFGGKFAGGLPFVGECKFYDKNILLR